jgi:hypothetical protein
MKEKTMEQLRKIELEIYRAMFKEAKPPADFDKMFNNPPRSEWYNQHYLDAITQHQIIDKICMKHKLTPIERSVIGRHLRLGFTPATREIKNNPYAYKPYNVPRKK